MNRNATKDKLNGAANELSGALKEGLGKVLASDKMQAEGQQQQLKGAAQRSLGMLKEQLFKGTKTLGSTLIRVGEMLERMGD